MKDILDSIKYNFIERTTNPFLVTYLVVMLLRNWELLFMLFNFDSGRPLTNKINMITTYLNHRNIWFEIWNNTWISFLILIGTYLLLSASRLIVNTYHKIVLPIVYKWTDKSSIVLKSVYNDLKNNLNTTSNSIDSIRESKAKIEIRISEYENTIAELRLKIAQLENTTKEEVSNENEEENKDVANAEINHFIELTLENEEYKKKEVVEIVEKLKEKNLVDIFLREVLFVLGGGKYNSNSVEIISEFIALKLFTLSKEGRGYRYFKVSDLGDRVYNHLRK